MRETTPSAPRREVVSRIQHLGTSNFYYFPQYQVVFVYYSIEKTIKPPSGHALLDLVHLVLGQIVALLLSLCMAKWLRKWRRGWLYVRSNTKKRKVSNTWIPHHHSTNSSWHCWLPQTSRNQLMNIDEPHIIWYDLIFFPTYVSRLTIL